MFLNVLSGSNEIYLPKLTKAVSNNFATANKDGSQFEDANSILSSESRQRASMRYLTDVSDNSSKNKT